MGITADQSVYRGLPIAYEIADEVDWEEFAPVVGGIKAHTSILDSEEWHPDGSYSLCDEQKTIPTLWNLARAPAARAQLIKNAYKIYTEIQGRLPSTSAFHALPLNAPPQVRQEFIETLLAPPGLAWFENANEGNLFAYARIICQGARLPHYVKEFTETMRGFPQKLISFSENGQKLSPAELELYEEEFYRVYCRINGYVFDLHGPGHSELGVLIDGATTDGSPESQSLKNIHAAINRLLSAKNGGYRVSVPTAYENSLPAPHPRRLKFNRHKRINIYVAALPAAQALVAHWGRFGEQVALELSNEKD